MKNKMKNKIIKMVNNIANNITNDAIEFDDNDYLSSAEAFADDALDISYRVGQDKKYLSCELLVAFGGPNIYVDTQTNTVKGSWGADSCECAYTDNIGLNNYMAEIFDC